MKIDADEKELLESVERGEWKSAGGGKRERARFSRYAKATFKKDRRLNIRLSSKDLEAIQKRALAEGLPYQTLIASLLHKYASGRLKEVWYPSIGPPIMASLSLTPRGHLLFTVEGRRDRQDRWCTRLKPHSVAVRVTDCSNSALPRSGPCFQQTLTYWRDFSARLVTAICTPSRSPP